MSCLQFPILSAWHAWEELRYLCNNLIKTKDHVVNNCTWDKTNEKNLNIFV